MRPPSRIAAVLTLFAVTFPVGCGHDPTPAHEPNPPVIDANALSVSAERHERPADPAGILAGQWPNISAARVKAISKAVFDRDLDNGNTITVVNLGAEGSALGTGDSITSGARNIWMALDLAEVAINVTKQRMASIASEADPADRHKITELATDLSEDLRGLGNEANERTAPGAPPE